jgi:hypothetical protein
MKDKKGFREAHVLIISSYEMDSEFQNLFYKRNEHDLKRGYNRYYSEFDPCGSDDYSDTFTQENLNQYWQDQTNDNNYKGSLEQFVKDYGLELDVWFINCGYDFSGVKIIIIEA